MLTDNFETTPKSSEGLRVRSGFVSGLKFFFESTSLVFSTSETRSWYFNQLKKALFVGLLVLGIVGVLLIGLFTWLVSFLGLVLESQWLEIITSFGVGIFGIFIFIFAAGPVSLLVMNTYLTEFTNWQNLQKTFGFKAFSLEDRFRPNRVLRSVFRGAVLIVFLIPAFLIGLIPGLFFVPMMLTSYGLAKEWFWTIDDMLPDQRQPEQTSVLYSVGFALIPVMLSPIPFVGISSLPILQAGSVYRYHQKETL